MTLYTDILDDDDADNGVHREDFAQAVSIWAWMQQRSVTVAEATMAFNTTPDLIRQAVTDHAWSFLCPENEPDPAKQLIEHDGE